MGEATAELFAAEGGRVAIIDVDGDRGQQVADRIAAEPGTKKIGRLSLFVQYHTDPKVFFKIKRNSFYPIPEVDSVFLRLAVTEKKRVEVRNEKLLFDLIKTAYSQRR